MAIRPHEIAALLSKQVDPTQAASSFSATIGEIIANNQATKKVVDDLALERDKLKSLEKYRAATIKQSELDRELESDKHSVTSKRQREDLELRERQHRALQIKAISDAAKKDPLLAKALAENEGVLAGGGQPPAPAPAPAPNVDPLAALGASELAPALRKAVGEVGIPGLGDPVAALGKRPNVGVQVGGETYQMGGPEERALDAQELTEAFVQQSLAAPEEYRGIAEQIAESAPAVLDMYDGDKEKAAKHLTDRYDKLTSQMEKTKKKRMKAYKKGGSFDESDYRQWVKTYEPIMKRHGYNDHMELLGAMNDAYANIKEGYAEENGAKVWNGVRAMLSMQGEGSRPSDFDVKMAQGMKSWAQEIKDAVTKGTLGSLNEETVDNMLATLRSGMTRKHSRMRGMYNEMMGIYEQYSKSDSERAALDTLVGALFDRPYFKEWYRPTGYERDADAAPKSGKTKEAAAATQEAMGELEALVQENSNLLEGE